MEDAEGEEVMSTMGTLEAIKFVIDTRTEAVSEDGQYRLTSWLGESMLRCDYRGWRLAWRLSAIPLNAKWMAK